MRATSIIAWGLFGLFLVIAGVELWLIAIEGRPLEDVFFFFVVGYVIAGALIVGRQPRNAVGWLLLTIGIGLSAGGLADTNIRAAEAPLFALSAWVSAWGWFVWLICAGIFLPLVFPTGRLVSRRWRPVLWLGVAALVVSVIAVAFAPGPIDTDAARPVANPVGIEGLAATMRVLSEVGNFLMMAAFLGATASLVVRFRRSRGTERQQLKWFAYAAGLVATGLGVAMLQVFFGLSEGDSPQDAGWLEVVGTIAWFTALGGIVIAIPLATGMAILRHRLYDIDVVIRRTLVYAALVITLVAAYASSVLLLQLVLSPGSDLAVAASTLAVAALFRPAIARIREAVDRRFYRSRYDAVHTVEHFGARLRDEVELDALSADLRATVRETMQPAHVSLWLRGPA